VLERIEPADYWPALTGDQVDGRRARCPLPGHEDRRPSVVLYGAGRGWWCPVCDAGGSAIDLAAAVTGIDPRGAGYLELRRYVARRLLAGSALDDNGGQAATIAEVPGGP